MSKYLGASDYLANLADEKNVVKKAKEIKKVSQISQGLKNSATIWPENRQELRDHLSVA